LDSYSCVIPRDTANYNKESLLSYLNRIGRPVDLTSFLK